MKRAWAAFRGWPKWAQIAAWVVAGIIVLAAIAPAEDEGEQTVTAGQTPTTTAEAPAPTAAPTTPPPPTTAAPTTTPGPKTEFGNGTHRVGIDIAPGTYVAPGGSGCYWERQSVFGGGSADAIIANEFSRGGQVVVTIAASDKGFRTNGCGTWRRG